MKINTPYYAVIFSSKLKESDKEYGLMADKLESLLVDQPGFMGMESARNNESYSGITVCYWKDLESIKNWKNNGTHLKAQKRGKDEWYSNYTVRICKVEKEYSMV